MKTRQIKFATNLVLIFITIILFFWWTSYHPSAHLKKDLPGEDGRPKGQLPTPLAVIGRFFQNFEKQEVISSENWPGFRGNNRDNIYQNWFTINLDWQTNPPQVLWEQPLGEGYSGAAIYNGRVYVLDYHEEDKSDLLRCFSLVNGQELWRRWYGQPMKRNHGFSRTIPAVNEQGVVTLGPQGHVMCCDPISGELLWSLDLQQVYQSSPPLWYTGQCPVILENIVILAPCGSALIIGVDINSGEVVWEIPNEQSWKMSHSSVMPMEFEGEKLLIYCAIGGLVGININDILQPFPAFQTDLFNHSVIAPSPVILDQGQIFLSAGYGAGSMMIKISKNHQAYKVEKLYENKPGQGLSCEQQTPIYTGGYLYGIMPDDAGPLRNQFVCYAPNNQLIWNSGAEQRFGLGPFLQIMDYFLILADEGELSLIKVSDQQFQLITKMDFLEGRDAWAPLAIANGLLIMRDSYLMKCIDLNAN
ncbi:MAG: PQQ-like beta-propeller repeat protein [Spirochaetes bacterium]|nr:PQQ-like beta-propeller repeat protein [Spirochaetota bacterium]